MNPIQKLHSGLVFPRRSMVIAKIFSEILPKNASILDIGCGDGIIDALIIKKRPDIQITGLDVLRREKTAIQVAIYDGKKIPFPDKHFDCSIFIDTLHHENNLPSLLAESCRVTKNHIIIKDHYADNNFSVFILKIMDWVGNKSYNVHLPYNYLSKKQWQKVFHDNSLLEEAEVTDLGLYPFPFSLIFEKGIHFITKLKIGK